MSLLGFVEVQYGLRSLKILRASVCPLSRVSIDAANLVANYVAAIEFDNALAHLIHNA
jgi:hypothetical protein